jgi:lipoprotein-anchoring transpeptidase ErfK/SrfK
MWRTAALACTAALALAGLTPLASAAESLEVRAKPTVTARVVAPANALGAPRRGARQKMRLYGATAWSRSAQRLMVTGRHVDRRGREWVRVQLPIRPNQASGWVRADRVRLSTTRVRFEVHLRSRTFSIWRGTRRLATFPAGVGRAATPTPVGRFAIQDPFVTLPEWRSVYGRFTLTLTAHSPVLRSFMGGDGLVAIHGTGSGRGWRVGVASSNGCVVLSERALAVAARFAAAGTPVLITRD